MLIKDICGQCGAAVLPGRSKSISLKIGTMRICADCLKVNDMNDRRKAAYLISVANILSKP